MVKKRMVARATCVQEMEVRHEWMGLEWKGTRTYGIG